MAIFVRQINELKKQSQEHKTQLGLHDQQLIDFKNLIEDMKKKQDETTRKLTDIQSKVEDFNVIELLKSAGGSNQGGDANIALGLIQNLEKKFVQKFKFSDERIGKNEEDILRLKNDSTNIKNMQDSNGRAIQSLDDKHEALSNEIKEQIKKLNEMDNQLSDSISTKYTELSKMIEDKLKELSEQYDNKIKEVENSLMTQPSNPNQESEGDVSSSKQIKEIMKKIAELDKNLKLLPAQINIEAVWKAINETKDAVNDKATKGDVEEVRNLLAELQKQINFVKDQVDTLIEDQTDHDDIQNLKRKLESLANKVIELKVAENESSNVNNSNSYRQVQIDSSKFVEITQLNNFKTQIVKEFENVNDNFASMRRMIDDIFSQLKSKTTFKDLKTLEDDLMAKLEDLKLACNKKFADKIETGKNVKYLDQQIKHIIEVYIKRMDKGDSWLLAKKPLGGHLCASCENYIGDLKENNNYVPWNKYPMRDPNDKLYRIGNGFSKMLQMITVDGVGNPDKRDVNFQTSQEFYENSKTVGSQPREHSEPKGLPKIKTKRNVNSIENEEDVMGIGEMAEEDVDPTQPKITKIYKIPKKE